MVVDEGVLSLMGYKTPDPLTFFWSGRGADTGLQDSRDALLKRRTDLRLAVGQRNVPAALLRTAAALSLDFDARLVRRQMQKKALLNTGSEESADRPTGAKGGDASRIRSRSLFATTAYYNPSVTTGTDGKATLQIKMPDNLTTFRIMAVALDRGQIDRFGQGEAQVKVRKLLLLRPALPRFLSLGDRVEAAVMVHNETRRQGMVDVLLRGRNIKLEGARRKRVQIPAGRATEVRFTVRPVTAGPARLQFAAVMGQQTDAVEQQIPVLLPATTEAFATYGMTEGSVAQAVVPPNNALAGYGGLEISIRSAALRGLRVHLPGPGHDAGPVRGRPDEGRGDVPATDLRSQRHDLRRGALRVGKIAPPAPVQLIECLDPGPSGAGTA